MAIPRNLGAFADNVDTNGNLPVTGIAGTGSATGRFLVSTGTGTAPTWNANMVLDSSGNLGLGGTPSAWNTGALQIRNASFWGASGSPTFSSVGSNYYYDGAYRYISNAQAADYYQFLGQHIWRTAGSGIAGNPISFTQAMTLNASGALGFGNTPSYGTSGQVLTSAGSGAAPTWSTISAGNMSVFTANGASVPAGNAFLLSSTSSIPSGWSFNGTGNGFTIPAGQSWVGLINSRMFAGVFAAGGMTHNDGGTTQRWMFNSGSLSTASNIDQYLPMIMFRLY